MDLFNNPVSYRTGFAEVARKLEVPGNSNEFAKNFTGKAGAVPGKSNPRGFILTEKGRAVKAAGRIHISNSRLEQI
jgi:hypothetical protein